MSNAIIGYLGIVFMVVLMFAGMPIYLAMLVSGAVGLIIISNLGVAQSTIASMSYQWSTNWILICIPLFILMGEFASSSGISRELFDVAQRFVGHFRGGLAMATTIACTAFGAISGSSLANAGTMGVIAIPEMERYKYDKSLAAGTVAAGGTIGVMIPPSTGLIILGLITMQSIGALFIAAILPGLLLMATFIVTIAVIVRIKPSLAPPAAHYSWRDRFNAMWGMGPVIIIFVIVIGGMYAGVFTATEAAAIGTFFTFIFVLLRRRLTKKALNSALMETVKTSAMIFVLFIGANTFGNFMALTGLPVSLAEWLISLKVSPYLILGIILFFYIPVGCFMDLLSAWMVTLPIFYPIIQQLGFNIIWFLIMMQVVGELGMITPPVGLNVFVVQGITKLPLSKIFAGTVPFYVADMVALLLIFFFPQIPLFLPGLMS